MIKIAWFCNLFAFLNMMHVTTSQHCIEPLNVKEVDSVTFHADILYSISIKTFTKSNFPHCLSRCPPNKCLGIVLTPSNGECLVMTKNTSGTQPAQTVITNDNGKKIWKSVNFDYLINQIEITTTTTPEPTTTTLTLPAIILIQQHVTHESTNKIFNKLWTEYQVGFGNPSSDYWIGLDKLHSYTTSYTASLRVEMTKWDGTQLWAEYSSFRVGPSSDKYRLQISGYNPSSTAGDSLTNSVYGTGKNINNMQFSTKDQDNDPYSNSCSVYFGSYGGWWFNFCYYAHPNGILYPNQTVSWAGVYWYSATTSNASLKSFKMFITLR